MRIPVVSGTFYESNLDLLKNQIKECFSSLVDLKDRNQNNLKGVISPHAGYMFSGVCQAYSFAEIKKYDPELLIILGLSHRGFPSCISIEDWQTPLGVVKVDKEFQENVVKSLPVNEKIHATEHSIEVQLPFLQHITSDISIAPIIVSPDKKVEDLANILCSTIKNSEKKCLVLASSDFTHYGLNYGYVPFTEDVKKNIYNLDKKAIKRIEHLDWKEFLEFTEKTGATICGKYPIAVLIEMCKRLGARRGELLHYYTSGDVLNDYKNAVGYGSIRFIS